MARWVQVLRRPVTLGTRCHCVIEKCHFPQLHWRSATSWARVDGKRPRAMVIHPRLPGDREELVAWDAAEALALARALRWQVSGEEDEYWNSDGEDSSSAEDSSDEEEDLAEYRGKSESGEEVSMRDRSVWFSDEHTLRMDRIDSRLYFPTAELSRIAVRMVRTRSDLLFVNDTLSPAQQRNLEAAMDLVCRARRCRSGGAPDAELDNQINVFDRSRVVLAIFACRATTPVARLRIEIAQAQQAKAKLGVAAVKGISGQLQRVADAIVRSVPGCDRNALLALSGAAGGVSTSFNSSSQKTRQKQQRAVEEKEKQLREELSRLQMHRDMQRQRRKQLWTIGLAGYTNVGKSAIVNRLTGSNLVVKDGVFVTLDIAARRVPLPSGASCYVLDSVGFVKDLPLELCDAFAATVEELRLADVVLHVRDLSHPSRDEHFDVVADVLSNSGVDLERRVIEVWNKQDLMSRKEARHFRYIRAKQDSTPVHLVSALTGDGFDELLEALDQKLQDLSVRRVPGHGSEQGAVESARRGLQRVSIPSGLAPADAAERWTFLRDHGAVVEDSITAKDGVTVVDVWMDDAARAKCLRRFGNSMLS